MRACSGAPAPTRHPLGFIEPCIPCSARTVPAGPQWIHEIKHDGFRLIVCRRAGRVRLFTRRGYDWTDRYRLIVAAAEALPSDATIDGEVVVCDGAGVADFERLRGRAHDRYWRVCVVGPVRGAITRWSAARAGNL